MGDQDPDKLTLWPGGGGGGGGGHRTTVRNIIFLALTFLRSSGVMATPYEHYELFKELFGSVVYDQKDNAPTHCYCKVSCTLEPECTAGIIIENDDGTANCLYSNTQVLTMSDTQPKTQATTFFKSGILEQESPPLEQQSKSTTGSTTSASTKSTTESTTTYTTESITSTTPSTTTTETLVCKTDFHPVPNVGCVRVVDNKKKWWEAKSWCQARQADLYVADTEEKFEDFAAYVRNFMEDYSNIWIKVKNEKWDGGRYVTVNEWAAGEPISGDNCSAVSKPNAYKLAERDCNKGSRFACWYE